MLAWLLNLALGGTATAPPPVVPSVRVNGRETLIFSAENRSLAIPRQDRTMVIPRQDRDLIL